MYFTETRDILFLFDFGYAHPFPQSRTNYLRGCTLGLGAPCVKARCVKSRLTNFPKSYIYIL